MNKFTTCGGFLIFILTLAACTNSTDPNTADEPENVAVEAVNLTYALNESLDGWLKIGVDQNLVVSKLGPPEKRGEFVEDNGEFMQEWDYPSEGINLRMSSATPNDQQLVSIVFLSGSNDYKTSKNISIGSTKEDVLEQYALEIKPENVQEGQIIITDDNLNITHFMLDSGKVSTIFIGKLRK